MPHYIVTAVHVEHSLLQCIVEAPSAAEARRIAEADDGPLDQEDAGDEVLESYRRRARAIRVPADHQAKPSGGVCYLCDQPCYWTGPPGPAPWLHGVDPREAAAS